MSRGGELCDIGVGERTPSDFWQKEGRLCQKLENFQKAVWKAWKNCIFTFIVRDTWGRRTWREAGKENLPGILLQTWKQDKNCYEWYTLYLPSTFSIVPVVLKLFVLERILLLPSYSTVLMHTGISPLNSKSGLFFSQNQGTVWWQNWKGVVFYHFCSARRAFLFPVVAIPNIPIRSHTKTISQR